MTGDMDSLFDIAALTPPPKESSTHDEPAQAKRTTKTTKVKQVSWTVNTTRVTCYTCVQQLVNGEFITLRQARWARTENGHKEMLCYEHAVPRREADALQGLLAA